MAHFVDVPKTDDQIIAHVHVSTGAEATTIVQLVESDSTRTQLTASPNPDGIIPDTPVGTGNALSGRVLKIKTIIELELIPEGLRQTMIDNLVVIYTFKDGVSTTTFSYDDADKQASPSKLFASVISTVQLISL